MFTEMPCGHLMHLYEEGPACRATNRRADIVRQISIEASEIGLDFRGISVQVKRGPKAARRRARAAQHVERAIHELTRAVDD